MASDKAASINGGKSASKPGSSDGGGGTSNKKYYPKNGNGVGNNTNDNNDVHLFPSSKLKLLHQRTSLSLAYDRERGWGYQGETAMYVIANNPDTSNTNIAQQKDGGNGKDDKSNNNASSINSGYYTPLGEDGTPIELALHMRDGCCVESVEIYGAARKTITTDAVSENGGDKDAEMADVEESEKKTKVKASSAAKTINQLHPIPNHSVSFSHHDPLSIVMKRPAKFHSVEDDGNVHFDKKQNDDAAANNKSKNNKKQQNGEIPRRYEADFHATRGTKGITYSIRAASISSAVGELRIGITAKPKENGKGRIKLKVGGSSSGGAGGNDADSMNVHPPQSEAEAMQCWKDDLLLTSPSDEHDAQEASQMSTIAGETPQGTLEQKMNKEMMRHRCQSRREARLELIAKSLAEATCSMKCSDFKSSKEDTKWPLSPAMKIVVRFGLRHPAIVNGDSSTKSFAKVANRLHLGGINFMAPSQDPATPISNHPSLATPHVYTICGTHGDHQGVRSWLPTLDSASPNHRASHELVVKITSRQNEGLWPAASGEDFGYNQSVSHPILGNDANEMIFGPMRDQQEKRDDVMYQRGVAEAERVWNAVDDGIAKALGCRHAQFMNDFFYGSSSGDDGGEASSSDDKPQKVSSSAAIPDFIPSSALDSSELNMEMLSQIRNIRPVYVTSMFSSLTWSPCPSRSIGFAIGPFATLYDPEYFRLENDGDDSDSDMEDDANDADNNLSLHETARKLGEGIRQLYFAPKDDRRWIHGDVNDEFIFGEPQYETGHQHRQRPELSTSQLQANRQLEGSILASTIGVPNRALSLMRDVLALPAYRTSSYTQIWIPNAHMSGDSCGGNMVGCPEVNGCNSFLGGAIMDSTMLPPPGMRLPYYDEGRTLQFLQARNAIRGWVRAALPLGADDDVGQGYLHTMAETFLMSLYERGHGAFGEGGGRGSFFYTKRYAIGSGLNSTNLDFLPLVNIEDDEVAGAGIAIEERGNEHLWRSLNNGTETHTSSLDEYAIGQLLAKDFIEALERSDRSVPLPSMGWIGSHQSATFLTHNSASSTSLGCGALDFVHPMGGQMYRSIKSILLNRVYEGRSSISHFTRVFRAAFIASFLRDVGVSQLKLPDEDHSESQEKVPAPRPPFVVCIDEIIKKQALSHAIFTRALRVMSGPIHEPYLRGNLVDIGRENYDTKYERKLVTPEGFPNSFVRGASALYMRVGAHIEAADGSSAQSGSAASQSAAAVKGIHLHIVAEPVIPEGASAFGGPVTLRVIENEGQCREFIKNIPEDGSRSEWGPVFLHARPVSTAKQQQAASGISEAPTAAAGGASAGAGGSAAGGNIPSRTAFTNDHLHRGGFQMLELMRITNVTPLLWVRVDPHGLYNGRLNIFQQDACLAEQIFHDGDAAGQVEAMRALAERPLKIQGIPKITNIHDVPITELPVRVLGDCLRGSVALHCDLPHNPAVRAQAALAIAQWQNNKAPESSDVIGGSSWLGLELLMQYFKERFYCNGQVLPNNFRRILLHKHIAGVASGGDTASDGGYQYLDALTEKDERRNAIAFADEAEIEEDEEYRVRSACVTAIASIRAQDGMTPKTVVKFLEEVLLSGDKAAVGSLLLPHEEEQLKKKQDQALDDEVPHSRRIIGPSDDDVSNLPYVSLSLVADALLALCYVHVRPQSDFDPTGGRPVNPKADHPILPLMELCLGWLDWDLERIRIRAETNRLTGIGDACHASISPCAITALCHMSLLKQSTTPAAGADKGSSPTIGRDDDSTPGVKRKPGNSELEKTTTAQFYIDIFDDNLVNADAIRAAAAQSVVCICCAADRDEVPKKEPLGLLVSLEFMLDRILEPMISPGLRLTLALLMMDACTGKISTQRVASFCGQNRLCGSGTRFMNGPLGASCGGDNGSALLLTVSDVTYPAANAVNDGARQGLRLLRDSGKERAYSMLTGVRVAAFATKLWRTINGELISPGYTGGSVGICAHDTNLRCALVALWQWVWPRNCNQLPRAQSLHKLEGTPPYFAMGANHVMKTTESEKAATDMEDELLKPLAKVVEAEIDRQTWRGEMAGEAYSYFKSPKEKKDLTSVNQPLPVVVKDAAWKVGGWVASTAQQRRKQGADGGSAVSKIRLVVKSSSTVGENS